MALPQFNENVDIITGLADKPTQSASELKAKFDEAPKKIKTWINTVLIPTLNSNLANKVNVVSGKQLSTEDYTTEDRNKLAGIQAEATKNVITSGTTVPTGGSNGDIYIQYFE